MMQIEHNIPLLEEILGPWKDRMGGDYEGYKNHVYRMLHFCFFLCNPDEEVRQKLVIAGAFHDLGIWSEPTVDYLPSSITLANAYLAEHGLAHWSQEIALVIEMHHKLGQYRHEEYPLVEVFRRGDLVDFSLGAVQCGVPTMYIQQVKASFPNAGFHKRLMHLLWPQFKTYPLNPAPTSKQ